MSKYICFTNLKHLIFWNGGSNTYIHIADQLTIFEFHTINLWVAHRECKKIHKKNQKLSREHTWYILLHLCWAARRCFEISHLPIHQPLSSSGDTGCCTNLINHAGPSSDWLFLRFQWRPSWMLRRKSVVESIKQAVGTGHGETLQMRASPGPSWILPLPSKDAHACPLLFIGTCTRKVTYSGSIKGRNDNEWGHIGVKRIPGTCIYRWNIAPKLQFTQLKW
jgi:hypothetical protein